jgi:hypothetical protein
MNKVKKTHIEKVAAGVFLLLFVAAIIFSGQERYKGLWIALSSFNWFFLMLLIADIVFHSIQTIIQAKWSKALISLSLISEPMKVYLLFSFLLLFGSSHFILSYENAQGWQHPAFSSLRASLFLLIWIALHSRLRKNTKALSPAFHRKQAIIALLIVFLSFSMFSWDWLMNIHQSYYSAMYSFYLLISCLALGNAYQLVVAHKKKKIQSYSDDLSRYTLALSLLWFYTFYSPFLIAWYTALPEELMYYNAFMHFPLNAFLVILLLTNFLLTFLLLLSKKNRQNPGLLLFIGIMILAGKFLEILLQIIAFVPHTSNWIYALCFSTLALLGYLIYKKIKKEKIISNS